MSSAPERRVGYGAALASREFRALFAGQLASVTGTSVAAVALTIVVYRRTGSPLLASLTFALGFVPYLVGGGLLAGVVDRVRPRRLVAGCDLASALLAAATAWPALPVPVLLTLLFAIGTLSAISSGARADLVRSSVSRDTYVPARSLLRIASQLAQVGGNAGGGALLLVLSPSGALLVNAASFAFSSSVVRLALADRPPAGARSEATLVRDSLHGARRVLALPELRRLLLLGWLAPLFSVAPEALAAPYVSHHHGSSTLVGWWLVALPAGTIAGDIAGVRLLSAAWQRRLVGPAVVAGFLPYLLFVFDPSVPVALVLLAASGTCGLYMLGLDARTRDAAPPGLFARTMTLYQAGLMTLQGLGFALAGAVAELTTPATAVAIAGGCGLAVTIALVRPSPRRGTLTPAAAKRPARGLRGQQLLVEALGSGEPGEVATTGDELERGDVQL